MPIGLVIILAVLMALGVPRIRLSCRCPMRARRASSLARRLRMRQR